MGIFDFEKNLEEASFFMEIHMVITFSLYGTFLLNPFGRLCKETSYWLRSMGKLSFSTERIREVW